MGFRSGGDSLGLLSKTIQDFKRRVNAVCVFPIAPQSRFRKFKMTFWNGDLTRSISNPVPQRQKVAHLLGF